MRQYHIFEKVDCLSYFSTTFIILLFTVSQAFAGDGQNKYQVFIDLDNVVKDKVQVSITVPKISETEIEFQMPKIVPGTYSIYDFGRFTTEFEALDSEGQALDVDSITLNRRKIKEANRLATIKYWVEDTYDTKKKNFIFEPAGSSIEKGKLYVINTFAFIGYLESYKDIPYEVTIKHADHLFGATALQKESLSDTTDLYSAPNYFDLADGPIMYCRPDTTTFELGGAEILISVYSPNDIAKSDIISGYIKETMEAQKDYLYGKLPVDRYAFLIYHYGGIFSGSMALGALEHSYSSLYSLPELHPILNSRYLRDFTAHEFFHIITPLNIHSEEIGNFDFIEPKMSKHLWLYEGVTEYASGLAQVKYGKMDADDYLEVIEEKIKYSKGYDDELPFTELSEGCLDVHKLQYGNVYQKGALIGLSLDILLRKHFSGEYGLQDLIEDLSKKYGKDKSFKDEELFSDIQSLTFPEIQEFFDRYVAGPEVLPLTELFKEVGIDYTPRSNKEEITLGGISFMADDASNSIVITDAEKMNDFGKQMGYQNGDVITRFNGTNLTPSNFERVFEEFKKTAKEGDLVEVKVTRLNESGKSRKIKLQATALLVKTKTRMNIKWIDSPSSAQIALRKSWINK